MSDAPQTPPPHPSFWEAFAHWLKLGFISFGGPAGQIAIMHQDLVEKRRWISEHRFLHAPGRSAHREQQLTGAARLTGRQRGDVQVVHAQQRQIAARIAAHVADRPWQSRGPRESRAAAAARRGSCLPAAVTRRCSLQQSPTYSAQPTQIGRAHV